MKECDNLVPRGCAVPFGPLDKGTVGSGDEIGRVKKETWTTAINLRGIPCRKTSTKICAICFNREIANQRQEELSEGRGTDGISQ